MMGNSEEPFKSFLNWQLGEGKEESLIRKKNPEEINYDTYCFDGEDVDERGGMHVYQGKVVFWNGKGSYQVFANSVNESGFTKLNNSVLPLEDQTIIAACTFEYRLVVGTLQGNILWSPPNWDGVSLWDDVGAQGENYLKVTLGPGEIIEFMRDFRRGLEISIRTSAKASGRILNIPTLDAQGLSINVAGTKISDLIVEKTVDMSNYRMLGKGEIIQADDLSDRSNKWDDHAIWEKVSSHMVGKPASDPAFPAHSRYLRFIHQNQED